MKKFLLVFFVVGVIAGVTISAARAVVGQPSDPSPAVEENQIEDSGECQPSSTSFCTPYATSAYRRDCDPDYSQSIPAGCELVFHSRPNFCPRWLADGRVEYSQANCSMKRWRQNR